MVVIGHILKASAHSGWLNVCFSNFDRLIDTSSSRSAPHRHHPQLGYALNPLIVVSSDGIEGHVSCMLDGIPLLSRGFSGYKSRSLVAL